MNQRAEKSHKRLEFLSDSSKLLAASLDYKETLDTIARLAIPYFGDWCAIVVITPDYQIDNTYVAHVLPEKQRLLLDWSKKFPFKLDDAYGPGHTIQTRMPDITTQIPSELIQQIAQNPEHLEIMRKVGLTSTLCVPMEVRGRVIGSIGVGTTEPGHQLDVSDDALAFFEEFARRCAMAIENARLYAEAQKAIQLRDDFIFMAAHELRTPLTSLRMQTQMLDRSFKSGRSGDVAGFEILKRQIRHLLGLTEDLLDVSQIEERKLRLYFEQSDLSEIVRGVLEQFRYDIKRSGCDVRLTAEPALGNWDRQRIEQVVVNLLTNALKYGEARPIDIVVSCSGSKRVLAVKDHGIGLREEDQGSIFQRFGRVAPMRNYGGLGLGLYIARQIVEAHGGTIRVESVFGKGASFIVELPAETVSKAA